jgi:hypothetical protein
MIGAEIMMAMVNIGSLWCRSNGELLVTDDIPCEFSSNSDMLDIFDQCEALLSESSTRAVKVRSRLVTHTDRALVAAIISPTLSAVIVPGEQQQQQQQLPPHDVLYLDADLASSQDSLSLSTSHASSSLDSLSLSLSVDAVSGVSLDSSASDATAATSAQAEGSSSTTTSEIPQGDNSAPLPEDAGARLAALQSKRQNLELLRDKLRQTSNTTSSTDSLTTTTATTTTTTTTIPTIPPKAPLSELEARQQALRERVEQVARQKQELQERRAALEQRTPTATDQSHKQAADKPAPPPPSPQNVLARLPSGLADCESYCYTFPCGDSYTGPVKVGHCVSCAALRSVAFLLCSTCQSEIDHVVGRFSMALCMAITVFINLLPESNTKDRLSPTRFKAREHYIGPMVVCIKVIFRYATCV